MKEAEYYLPFDTSQNEIRISQGRNGPWSHFMQRRESEVRPGFFIETDLVNAVDFALPFGSKVKAARDGVVLEYWLGNDWFYEGLDPEIGNNTPFMGTNFLLIQHEDQTVAWYSHLDKVAVVQKRQPIKVGDLIAYTGKSGWIGDIPHLHFQVNPSIRFRGSLPITFRDYNSSLDHETLVRENKLWLG